MTSRLIDGVSTQARLIITRGGPLSGGPSPALVYRAVRGSANALIWENVLIPHIGPSAFSRVRITNLRVKAAKIEVIPPVLNVSAVRAQGCAGENGNLLNGGNGAVQFRVRFKETGASFKPQTRGVAMEFDGNSHWSSSESVSVNLDRPVPNRPDEPLNTIALALCERASSRPAVCQDFTGAYAFHNLPDGESFTPSQRLGTATFNPASVQVSNGCAVRTGAIPVRMAGSAALSGRGNVEYPVGKKDSECGYHSCRGKRGHHREQLCCHLVDCCDRVDYRYKRILRAVVDAVD